MSSAATALPVAPPAKSLRKRGKTQRKKKSGPTVSDLILLVVSGSTERGGMSLAAVKKALQSDGYDAVKNRARVLAAIKRLVANKSLLHTKGIGASGSFKLNKERQTPGKGTVVRKKKQTARKVKTASTKPADRDAAPAAKKSPKKKLRAKSPKKAKRLSAAMKPKTSPRKSKRRVTKSTRTRAAAKK